MADKCHFAHGKEELRVVSDPLPENAPLIIDQKVQMLNSLGVACLFDTPNIKRQLREMGSLNLIRGLAPSFKRTGGNLDRRSGGQLREA